VAVFGAVANATIAQHSAFGQDALYAASHNVFLGVAVASVVGVLVLFLMPRRPDAEVTPAEPSARR
jgi:hypothetical protein